MPKAFDSGSFALYTATPKMIYEIKSHRELVYRPFQFHKRGQLFVRTHDETLFIAMRVHNPDRLPFTTQNRDPAQAKFPLG